MTKGLGSGPLLTILLLCAFTNFCLFLSSLHLVDSSQIKFRIFRILYLLPNGENKGIP